MKKIISIFISLFIITATLFFSLLYLSGNPFKEDPESSEVISENKQEETTEEKPTEEENKTPEPEVKEEGASPIMWEVSAKEGTGHIYFLGSVHVGDKSMYPLCEKVINAYNESEYLAVECDILAFSGNL